MRQEGQAVAHESILRSMRGVSFVGAVAAACLISSGAAAEKAYSLAPLKPAPGNERRIALVIGNDAYKTSPLRNPVKDARAMGRALAEAGFQVALVEDASLARMRRAIRDFGNEIAAGGVGLVYYAGHAVQVRGRNYLIPVNADIQAEDEVEDQAIDANFILAKMDTARNAVNILVLDACRNNPFARAFRSQSQGLAQMDAPSGTLIAYATAPGSVAADGSGENGLYTKHLLATIRQPGLAIEQLFKQVRIGVAKETSERQIPWESSSLKGDFYFYPGDPTSGGVIQKAAIDRAVSDAVKQAEDRAAKERALFQEQVAKDRAELQAEMRKLMEQLFAKQKTEREEEIRKRTAASGIAAAQEPAAAVTVVPDSPPKTQVAAVKPSALPETKGAPLHPGDQWNYRTTNLLTNQVSSGLVSVKFADANGVVESFGQGQEWAWGRGASVVGRGLPVLSPYLFALEKPAPGQVWRNIPYQRYCTGANVQDCSFEATYIGRERVTVAAGTFDAHKVEMTESISVYGHVRPIRHMRTVTLWYSDEAKRIVKAMRRNTPGRGDGAPEFDVELVSYKLN